jgi:O-antigen ligase
VRVLLIGTVALVVGFMVAPPRFFERIKGLNDLASGDAGVDEVDDQGSAAQRYEIWRVAGAIISENAVTGVGIGAYRFAHMQYARRGNFHIMARGQRDTHSTYLNLAAETGIPGLALWLALVGTAIGAAERARRRCKKLLPRSAQQILFLEVGLISFLVAGIFGTFVPLAFLYLHLVLLWAVSDLCLRELRLVQGARAAPGPAGTVLPPRPATAALRAAAR